MNIQPKNNLNTQSHFEMPDSASESPVYPYSEERMSGPIFDPVETTKFKVNELVLSLLVKQNDES